MGMQFTFGGLLGNDGEIDDLIYGVIQTKFRASISRAIMGNENC